LDSALNVKDKLVSGRFTALLQAPDGELAACDQPLYKNVEWVVAPTLGAIVPDWLIVVPRNYALSFRSWQKQHCQAPETIVSELCNHLGLTKDEVIWFEHGPNALGSSIGCGADHAHIHVILKPGFSFQTFLDQAISMSALDWTHAATERICAALPDEGSYLVAGSGNAAA
jgi:ATP adenylyltransferase